MDVEGIRRQNIRYWADKMGRGKLAEKIGYRDTVYLNQLCAGHGSFGARTARKIELALELERGWFDRSHAPEPPGVAAVVEALVGLTAYEVVEVLAQIDLIKRRKAGLLG